MSITHQRGGVVGTGRRWTRPGPGSLSGRGGRGLLWCLFRGLLCGLCSRLGISTVLIKVVHILYFRVIPLLGYGNNKKKKKKEYSFLKSCFDDVPWSVLKASPELFWISGVVNIGNTLLYIFSNNRVMHSCFLRIIIVQRCGN